MEQPESSQVLPHVVLLPFPAQGHIKPMFMIAKLLSQLANFQITFVNTQRNHDLLLGSSDIPEFCSQHPNFQLLSYSGINIQHVQFYPHDKRSHLRGFLDHHVSIEAETKSGFSELLVSLMEETGQGRPPTCIIADWTTMFSSAIDVAKPFGIPVIAFYTSCASIMWVSFHLLKLIEEEELEVSLQDKDMDKLITSIPGLENVFRCRDLYGLWRPDQKIIFKQVIELSTNGGLSGLYTQAYGLILNTFDKLEAAIISKLSSFLPENKVYTMGPLHGLLNNCFNNSTSLASTNNGILWKEDRSCITWLDSQPSKSVIYVSFGSLVSLSCSQILEFGHGLVNSRRPFLWVIRPESVIGEDQVLMELKNMSIEKGLIVSWAPQEKVLAHPAIGGFFTHCGWNSTLESIYASVPMICWPRLADQPGVSRCVSELWKIGFDIKDACDRSTIEKMVNDIMEDKRDEVMKSMEKIAKQAQDTVEEGGSSYCNLKKLISDIQSLIPLACVE